MLARHALTDAGRSLALEPRMSSVLSTASSRYAPLTTTLRVSCPVTINRDFQAGICSQKSIKRETRNAKRETRNAKRETRNAKRETRNAKRETRNAKRETRNAKRETPNAKRQTRNAKRQTPNAKRETRNAKRQTRYPTQTGLAFSTTADAIIFAASSSPVRPVFMTRS
jgi:uncharacterized protein (DUF3084 family)